MKKSRTLPQCTLASALPNNNILYNNFLFSADTQEACTTFEGYASIFNVVDKQYDIIIPGAFSNIKNKVKNKQNRAFPEAISSPAREHNSYINNININNNNKNDNNNDNLLELIDEPIIPILWQHNINEPIGKVLYLEQNNKGLYIKASLITEIPRGYEAYKLLENKVINGLSIGYIPKKFSTDSKSGYRIITSIDLIEISLVTFPANYGAIITSLSNKENKDHEKEDHYKTYEPQKNTFLKSLTNLLSLLKEP